MRNGATTWRDHDRARNVSESRISQASEADLSGPLPMSARVIRVALMVC